MAMDHWFPPIESKARTLSGFFAVAYGLIAAAFAIWYMYTSGFGLVSTESNRGLYLLLTAVLVFLGVPARAGAPKLRPSVVDIVFIVLTVLSIGYWIDQYVSYAIFRVSDPSRWDLGMGFIAIVVVLETSLDDRIASLRLRRQRLERGRLRLSAKRDRIPGDCAISGVVVSNSLLGGCRAEPAIEWATGIA